MHPFAPRNTTSRLHTCSGRLRVGVLTALGLTFTYATYGQRRQPEEVFPAASGSMADKRITLQAALAQHSYDAHAWYQLGLLEGQLHSFPTAEQDLRRSLALDSTVPEAHYLLGLALVANPRAKLDWPGAIAEFHAALKLRPEYADAYTYLGAGLTATGQNDEAVKALQNAVRLAPSSASAQFNLALALEPLMKDAEAAAAYRRAIAIRPGFAEAHSALGKLLFRNGDLNAAAHELREALRCNPDLQDAHYALGQVLRAQHHPEDARIESEIALSLGQRESDGITASQRSNAAMRLAASGDLTGAETMLREAIALRPDYGVPHYNLGLILADTGKWDVAVSQLSQAASLMPAQAGPWFELGRVLRRAGRNDEAIACLRWSAALDTPNEKVQAELREVSAGHSAVSQFPEAPAFGVRDESAEAFRAYAAQLNSQGDFQGTIGMLLRALTLTPAATETRLELARAYHDAGNTARALQEYRKILAVDSDNAAAHSAVQHEAAPSPR